MRTKEKIKLKLLITIKIKIIWTNTLNKT